MTESDRERIEREAGVFARSCDPLSQNAVMQGHLMMGYNRGATAELSRAEAAEARCKELEAEIVKLKQELKEERHPDVNINYDLLDPDKNP